MEEMSFVVNYTLNQNKILFSMSKELENYISFIHDHHLSKITNYFVKKATSDGIINSNGENVKNELCKEFRNLLNDIRKNDPLKINNKDLQKFKKDLINATLDNNQFAIKYIAFLNRNKETLIHFIPFYSNDINSSIELIDELDNLFEKLELSIIEQLNVSYSENEFHSYILDKTKKELKKVNIELQLSDQQLLETQKIANVGSFNWDLKSNKITSSEELLRILGKNRSDKINIKIIKSLMDKDSKEKFNKKLKLALNEEGLHESEYRIILDNSEKKYIVIRSNTIQDENKKTIQIIGLVMDITSIKKSEIKLNKKNNEVIKANKKLKKAKEKLKDNNKKLDKKIKLKTRELYKSNKQYQTFIKMSSEGIWRYGLRGIDYIDINLPVEEQVELIMKHTYFAESNDKMAQLQGYNNSKELIGKSFGETATSIPRDERKKIVRKYVKKGYRASNVRTKGKNKNGEVVYLQSSIIGLVKNNKLFGSWGIQRDITQKTIAEQSLKRSKETYKFLTENLPIIFWTATPDGYLDYGNEIWFKYTGSSKEQYKVIDWKAFVHPDDIKKTNKAWKDSIKNGKEFQSEYRLRDANGNYRWHQVRSYPYRDESGKIIKWMGTSIDIHEQKTYSDKLSHNNKELSKINNELDNLLYTVSHDLKSPLNNIEGLIATLKDTLPSECEEKEEIAMLMEMITDSVGKFKDNLMEVIDLAKAQKRGEETAEKNSLEDIWDEVKSDLGNLIENYEAKIKTDFSQCDSIYFNNKNLRSIIYNLVSNAIKYSSPSRTPKISINSKTQKKFKLLTVEDNGLGLKSTHIEDLISKRQFKNIEGSGVGLYILKRIMDNAGGKIEIESEKGMGSKFSIFFPI